MQPFGAAFRGFYCKGLQAVAEEIVAVILCLFGALANALAGSYNEERQVVTPAVLSGQNIVAKAKEVALPLPGKAERMQRLFRPWRKEMQ